MYILPYSYHADKKYSYNSIITLCSNLLSSQLSSSSSPSSSSEHLFTGPTGHILQFKIVGSGYFLISALVPARFLSGRFSMWIWKKVDWNKKLCRLKEMQIANITQPDNLFIQIHLQNRLKAQDFKNLIQSHHQNIILRNPFQVIISEVRKS